MYFYPPDFSGVVFDSRKVTSGCLYAALPGATADGHDFVRQAFAKGAKGLLVREDRAAEFTGAEASALIPVPDVKVALTDTARQYRSMLKAKVIGITGSAGKTTTKEFLAAFLRRLGTTHATKGNYNNDLGLPITILECPPDADYLILEMGSNHPGEIAYLADLARPDAGIISSVGTAHIEFFKTQDGIAEEKGALFRALPPSSGFAVVGANNDRIDMLKAMCECRVIEVESSAASNLACPLPGVHNESNMSLAYACAGQFGLSETAAQLALSDFSLPGDRWRRVAKDGVIYISDCYNANPTSMVAALETFVALKTDARRIAVLGDMYELGEDSERFHKEVKIKAESLPFEKIIYVGRNFGGLDIETAKKELSAYVRKGDMVLLKASNSVGLGRILD